MQDRIRSLLREKNAILLAHNYQPPAIQDLADLCGDSLELSRRAAATDAAVIVFCGVHFMAETASILSPQKTVLLPRTDAGCPMADMLSADALAQRKRDLPPMPVVTYVNSSAAVKARSSVCCTSANSVQIAGKLPEDELLMVPDRNLAHYTAQQTGKQIHWWEGFCPVHELLTAEMVEQARAEHPRAVFIAHPECRPEVLALAEAALSTSGMLRYPEASGAREFIIGTEVGLLHPLRRRFPDRRFYPASERMVCADMKRISPADIVRSLERMEGEVRVPEDVRRPAREAVERMLALSD